MGIRGYITEDEIEKAAIEVFTHPDINYRHFNCYTKDCTGRKSEKEVVIESILWKKLEELNPGIPAEVLEEAFKKLTSIDTTTTPAQQNYDMLGNIRQGIEVNVSLPDGTTEPRYIQVINWTDPGKNDFLVVSQLWMQGPVYRLRPDLIVYINGLPLVLIELKNGNKSVKLGYDDNITRYKEALPDLFVYNAFVIISNGCRTRIGSTFASWDYFFPWLRESDEQQPIDKKRIEQYGRSLDYAIRGLLHPAKLIDYIDNFVFFYNGLTKICARNHQFLGVNKAFDRFTYLREQIKEGVQSEEHSKLGVFWHTQGSGKSYSMVMFVRKIMRRFTGNYTFLIVTDREDLDGQLYKNFLLAGVVTEKDNCRPGDSKALRLALTTHTKCIFTLIQKFRPEKGEIYPVLSERDDIIVIIDEAHRSQYKDLAGNMRTGLPNAQFMAFTGTPLFGSKQLTNKWFGGNVSEYNFQQAVEDEATVPIYYRKCLPQVQQGNPTFSEDFCEIIESEELDDQTTARLEKEYASELSVLRNPDRLNEIAKYIAYHFPRRGYLGKGMVVSLDKFTTVRLYDLVSYHWKEELKKLNNEISRASGPRLSELIQRRLWMRETEMAVVVSKEAGEEDKFDKEGLDIKPHRKKMEKTYEKGRTLEDLFKDPDHPFRLVFLCSKWLTGFDVPTASVLYLDKPMRDHTLMQTIARVNRITDYEIHGKTKINGLIIDHCNVFGRLKKAMSTYGGNIQEEGESVHEEGSATPVNKDEVLFDLLQKAIHECVNWCSEQGIDLTQIPAQDKVFDRMEDFYRFADIIIGIENGREQLKVYDNAICSLYDSCRPEILRRREEFILAEVIHYLRKIVDGQEDDVDMNRVRRRIRNLLDESIVAESPLDTQHIIAENPVGNHYKVKVDREIDLSKLDIAKLREEYKKAIYKNIEIDDLKKFLEDKLQYMLFRNSTRTDFATRLQNIIDRYNAGSLENEEFFEELLNYQASLSEEDQRAAREGLTEEELEIFDLLKKESLTKKEVERVKLAAKALLNKLAENRRTIFVHEWFKDTVYQEEVKHLIGTTLDKYLPDSYDPKIFSLKKEQIYNCILTKFVQGRTVAGA